MTQRKKYTKLTPAKLARIYELIDNGWGNRRIAIEVGTSRQLVNYHRRFKKENTCNVKTTASPVTSHKGTTNVVSKVNSTTSTDLRMQSTTASLSKKSRRCSGTPVTTHDASIHTTCCQEHTKTTQTTEPQGDVARKKSRRAGSSHLNNNGKCAFVSSKSAGQTDSQPSPESLGYQPQQSSARLDGPKILCFDIETLPIESYTWGLFDQNVGLNQIKTDWAALSIAAKWMHEDGVWYEDTRHKATIRDDKDMIAKLCALLDQADIVVGQNVKKFDMRKIRARAMMHGLPPFKEPLVQDTMLMARSIGSFTSNKLEYLSKNLTDAPKSSHAKFPGFELWLGVMQGNQEAWDEMREYNIQDVIATEKLYLALRPWVRNHPNMSHYYNDDQRRCPRCGSVNLHANGITYRGVSEYTAFTCSDCGGHSRSRFTLNTRDRRKALLTTI